VKSAGGTVAVAAAEHGRDAPGIPGVANGNALGDVSQRRETVHCVLEPVDQVPARKNPGDVACGAVELADRAPIYRRPAAFDPP